MKLTGPFHIDGISFGLDALIIHCENAVEDGSMPDWKQDVLSFIRLFLDSSAGHILQETSGTTGDPKEYVLNKDSMVRSAMKTIQFFNLLPGDRALLCLPVRYIAGKMMVVRALAGGLDLVMVEPSGRPLRDIAGAITFGAMVPLQVYESLHQRDDLSLIEKLVIGGGELHPSVQEELTRIKFSAIYESFAMTETYTHFALKRINGTSPDNEFRLLEGVSIHQDERGCLVVDVPGVTTGAVSTNDLVEISRGGNSFKWLGRYDNVIKSGGIKIVPELLEQQITRLIGYTCLVIPEKDEKLGEKLTLLVEIGDHAITYEAWNEMLHENLPGHEVPRRIVGVEEIPRNTSFKPDRIAAMRLLKQCY
ncbi:MAG: AMP-binding protein [Bacteroidales bacterium]|nr:AMP-binding protein [Bacteroidales bacterium]